jgi:chemotaxis family two-component system sensor kinase Cph1
VHQASKLPESLRAALWPCCGLLALCIDPIHRGSIVLLRCEQIETIAWSGLPSKLRRIGPSGVRLTPQGSLAEWRQAVEGTAVEWSEEDLAVAHELTGALARAGAVTTARLEKARAQMLAVLGHDLRDPLHTISMLGELLQLDEKTAPTGYSTRMPVPSDACSD